MSRRVDTAEPIAEILAVWGPTTMSSCAWRGAAACRTPRGLYS
ncbi:hypothetical protein [Caulobacter sp. B11]|nr:hypothetical protein [Caulobacter sp. B11]